MNRSTCSPRPMRFVAMWLSLMLLTAGLSFAQTQGGNVVGKVVDSDGNPVPGVTVTLSGIGAPQMYVTTSSGNYRFLNMFPGKYTLRAELAGFSTLDRPVEVSVGANSEINFSMTPAVSEAITVSAETPLIDVRNTGTGADINLQELEKVPSARDPWVLLQTVPGVLVSTTNVGGNRSGQQSYFIGKGIERHQTEWNLDGVNVTEMAATGTTNFYYDFDSFNEVQMTTGGSDPRLRTPGVQINLVAKRGTNDFTGSGRYFWTDKQFQSDVSIPSEARDYLTVGNSIDYIYDYGAEAGGPVWKDRAWLWGAYSKNDINNFIAGPTIPQLTHLENWNAKLNLQIMPSNAGSFYYMYSNKTVHGRGLSITRPIETATDQRGPGHLLKFEDTQNIGSNFYATALFGNVQNGYSTTPIGGRDVPAWYSSGSYERATGVPTGWHRSYSYFQQDVPQKDYRIDAANFASTGKIDHELKWGFEYRDTPVSSLTSWSGNRSFGNFYDGSALAALTRDAVPNFGSRYKDVYLGDTVLLGNLTINAGARYDWQSAKNFSSSVTANPIAPDLLPATSFAGDDKALEWNGFSPRLGMTYAFGKDKRALVRGSYNHYINQIGSSDAGAANPFYLVQRLYYYWDDLNGDRTVQRNEIDFDSGLYSFNNIDPNNPAAGFSPGRLDYGMKPPKTDELIAGTQYELLPGFAVGANYTWRHSTDFTWSQFEKTRGAGDYYTSADYALFRMDSGTLPNGKAYSVPEYRLRSGVPTPINYVFTNRPDYSQTYQDLELTAIKRMANNWMMRANVTLADWTQKVGSGAVIDPTEVLSDSLNSYDGCSVCDGGVVASAGGIGRNYINSKWAYSVTGIYQFPWKISAGAALNGRQGYLLPYYVRVRTSKDGSRNILVGDLETRAPDVMNLDLRVAKDFTIWNNVGLNIAIDAFNVTNTHTVLDRSTQLDVGKDGTNAVYNHIAELQSPRVIRFGARFKF
ncbi:MAG: TonB-dependent receptor [Acidobacteriota bacterium]